MKQPELYKVKKEAPAFYYFKFKALDLPEGTLLVRLFKSAKYDWIYLDVTNGMLYRRPGRYNSVTWTKNFLMKLTP